MRSFRGGRRPGKHGNLPGFTLIEVSLALIVLFVSLVGGVALLSLNHRSLVQASARRLATWSALYQSEYLKVFDFDDLGEMAGEEVVLLGGKIEATRKTEIIPWDGPEEAYRAVVSVDWGEPGPPSKVRIDSLVTR